MFLYASWGGVKKGSELLLDYGPDYCIRAAHVPTHIRYYSPKACHPGTKWAEFFTVWWAANGVGEKACFTYETLAACKRLFVHPKALLKRVRRLGWQARRTPLAGVRMVGGADDVSGGVVESCGGAPGVAPQHFGADAKCPLVLDGAVSPLPAVVYQSSKAYCVPYSYFNVLALAGCGLNRWQRRHLERKARGPLSALYVVAHALSNMPRSEWSAKCVPLAKLGHATAADFVLHPSTRGLFAMGDGCHTVGILITDTRRLIADSADKRATPLSREALRYHCRLAVGPPGPEGCCVYELKRRTPEWSK
jgi:hypothetical protein